MVSQINPYLFIGSREEAENDALIKQLRISTIINVNTRETPAELEIVKNNKLDYVYYPQIGDPAARQRLFMAAGHLYGCLKTMEVKRVLIHCEAGVDRAPFVVAVAFKLLFKCSLADAYKIVKKERPCIIEHINWAPKGS